MFKTKKDVSTISEQGFAKHSSSLIKKTKNIKHQLPRISKNERIWELALERNRGTIGEDLMFAVDMKKNLTFSSFHKLTTQNDRFSAPEYRVMMPEPYVVTLFQPNTKGAPDNPFYVYATYNFTDELTKFEIFEQKLHFLKLVPIRKRIQFTLDLIASAMCCRYDFDRRSHLLQHRLRQKVQFDNYSRPMLSSARHLISRQEKLSVPIYGHLMARERSSLNRLMRSHLLSLEYSLNDAFDKIQLKIERFVENNPKWVECRKKFTGTPIYIHVNSGSFVNFLNDQTSANSQIRFRGVQDIFNEFNWFPSYFSHSVHFCRALKNCVFEKLDRNLVFRKADSNEKVLRVRPSRYAYTTSTTIVTKSNEKVYEVQLSDIPKRAPSLDSLSGFSSDSAASTATQTPLDWALNWKMQDKEYEHRYSKIGMPNVSNIKTEAKNFHKMRMVKEKLRRKILMERANDNFIFQENIPIFCEDTNIRQTRFEVYKGTLEMKKIRKLFENRKSADMSLNIVLSRRFEYLQQSLPHTDVSKESITLTSGWRQLSEDGNNNKIWLHLGRFLRRRCAWAENNCWSLTNTIPRCDRITTKIERKQDKVVLIFILIATCLLSFVTVVVISFN